MRKTSDMVKKTTSKSVKDKAVDAVLALAQVKGWDQISMGDIALKAGLPLPELFDVFETRSDVLVALGRRIDRRVLEAVGPVSEASDPRDRLFDILMERFDILSEDRAAYVSILKSFKLDPKQAVISLPHLCQSMSWMLEACQISTSGVRGAARVAGLTGIYLKTLRVWLSDDTADSSKTMAKLDQTLGKAERLVGVFGL